MSTPALSLLLHNHQRVQALGHNERLGQYFCSRYIQGSWDALYEADEATSTRLIAQWLADHHYVDQLPCVRPDFLASGLPI